MKTQKGWVLLLIGAATVAGIFFLVAQRGASVHASGPPPRPLVVVVGDSISEGSPLNHSARNPGRHDAPACAYAAVLYGDLLGFEVALMGNTQGSNNAGEVLAFDLTEDVWRKKPAFVHLHVGVNDIYDFRQKQAPWYGTPVAACGSPTDEEILRATAEHLAKLDEILQACSAHGAKLILDEIFPWSGFDDNRTGRHVDNTIRDRWNTAREAWAASRGVTYLRTHGALGQPRLASKAGDPPPPPGNLWDLKPGYSADPLGVHLTRAACAAAAAAEYSCWVQQTAK